VISLRRFWQPTLIQHISFPRVPDTRSYWEGAEARLRAAHERLMQRAKEGQVLPRSLGLTRARARLPESLGELPLEPDHLLEDEELEARAEPLEPPLLEH
jgi:hypothetical protein